MQRWPVQLHPSDQPERSPVETLLSCLYDKLSRVRGDKHTHTHLVQAQGGEARWSNCGEIMSGFGPPRWHRLGCSLTSHHVSIHRQRQGAQHAKEPLNVAAIDLPS